MGSIKVADYIKINIILLGTIFCMIHLIYCTQEYSSNDVSQVPLNSEGSITMNWTVDYTINTVFFEIHAPLTYGWFGIGFSDRGAFFPADYCFFWKDMQNKSHFADISTDKTGQVHLDRMQNCGNMRIRWMKTAAKFFFHRAFDTCDPDDYVIKEGTTHVVWVRSEFPILKADGLNITADQKGMVRVQLLKNTEPEEPLPPNLHSISVVAANVEVPANETTYWCHVQKLGDIFKDKHHVYKYEPLIPIANKGVVHHMEVFHCEAPPDIKISLYVGNCFSPARPKETRACKRVLAAWAMGSPGFTYPKEAGLPIGGGDFNPYVMLEVHYNNPEKMSGIIDSSGIQFHVSTTLKEMDAGVIELGLEYTDKMAIPPGQEYFRLLGYCVSECTSVSLPADGITVFGSQLHTHLSGVKVATRHIRNGVEIKELNRDDHYSAHFQEIRKLKQRVKILPGDALITQCDYNTLDRQNITLGGFAITDEMCVNYIHYFPATKLEVCKSAISDESLNTYFNYMKSWEYQKTSPTQGPADNYRAIEWNPMRVQLLREVYRESPLSMQCNMSTGDRFPGYWENTPVTPVLTPLPPPRRDC